MKTIQITTGSKPDSKIGRAARDLRGYLTSLFGVKAVVSAKPAKRASMTIQLQVSEDKSLSEQGYAYSNNNNSFSIIGGSSTAVMWGVYELAEFWGVRYLLHEDVLPDSPGKLRFPENEVHEPTIKQRGFRTYNDWPNTPCQWSLKQVEPLLDQLAKMRFNEIMIVQRPYDPFVHIEWRGVKKTTALVNYGYRFPIKKDWIGYDLFKESGDVKLGEFGNSDLAFHDSYEATYRAGKKYLRELCIMAHERGLKVTAQVVFTDFTEPIKNKLVKISDKKFLRRPDPGHVVTIRYGQWTEGMTKDMARCMTIRNPIYLELLAHNLQTHIDAFKLCDYIALGTSEFRQTGADVTYAWKQLDRKYKLSELATLDQLIAEARKMAEMKPDRAESELLSDICTLWVFDYLLNEHPPKLGRNAPKLIPNGLSVELHRFLPRIFPKGSRYLAAMGYMPSYAVKRADTLTPAREGAMKFSMILSTEDDNIGIVPQFSGPSVKAMAALIKKNNMHGFITRQFAHSKLLPAVHYLTHASWNRRMTMKQSYEHQFTPICGKRAMAPLLKAFGILERLTTDMHDKIDAVGFIHPTVITGHWKEGGALVSISDAGNLDRYEQIRKIYTKAAKLLNQAARQSKPAGRPVVYALARHADFAVDWMGVRIAMEQAQQLLVKAAQADKNEDIPGFADANDASEMKLREACELLNKATQAWADSVEDRCDLGVLAALNQYGIDALRSIHTLAHLRTIGWGKHQS